MENYLEEIIHLSKQWTREGHVASYIPKLSLANPKDVGVGIYTIDNQYYESGDTDRKFSIQSVGKIFSLICAIKDSGLESFRMKIDVEPSGDRFNSLVKLEQMEEHRPLNPFINAGAIATISLIRGKTSEEKFNKVIQLIRQLTDNPSIDYSEEIYESEKESGNTNRAIAYFLKGAGIVEGHVDEILNTYFKMCSIEVTIEDMAKASAVIANNGVLPWSGERVIDRDIIKIVRAIMTTSGLYDGSGDFAVRVGYPAKSGVGGCILGCVPATCGVATYGPSLNHKGNSVAGLIIHEKLSSKYDWSLF